ncbi:MAG: hypothetical protein ALECFALPRED_002008 [Alectoria fallacina]|uniref:Cns1/TTC4 wheel domain-containing protein n=1 Tax=Alectoria fallacina TaxID=1903189 RepID=A0A8H3FB41_9LECA|nr:MAG: hypothetical protein ALECFALPRED_002008 [Alectoria fallacina]
MSRVEELPDDFDESLNLNPPPAPAYAPPSAPNLLPTASSESTPFPIDATRLEPNGTTPALPPHMASVRSHTADEIVQMMNRTPLFMTSLESTAGEDGDNMELDALRALQYEGTPAEVAQGFKEQGNEVVKLKRWKDGKEFYTKGLAVLVQREKDRSLKSPDEAGKRLSIAEDEAEIGKEKELEEICYVNRALCNLEIKNYRSTTLDCASALRLNPKNTKAYYRSSLALFALDKVLEASDACARGLAIDPANGALKALAIKIEARQKSLRAVEQKKHKREQRTQKEKLMLNTALRARNIRTRSTAQPPDMEDASIHLSPDPVAPTSTLMFPVVLLYPLHLQSDFVKAFSETDTVPSHLEYVFPLPWDEKHEYRLGSVEFYMETGSGGLIKVGKKVSLGKVLGRPGVEIVDGVVRMNVLLKARAAGWIEEMKVRKGR